MSYEKGARFRVARAGCYLVYTVPVAPFAHGFRSVGLAVGDVLTCAGSGYSGGSDGIHRPAFSELNGVELPSRNCEFNPNSWGAPVPGSLEEVVDA